MAQKLLNEPLEPIPQHLIMRDVLRLPLDDREMSAVRERAYGSKLITDLIARQQPDGSFGPFRLVPGLDTPNGGLNETMMIRAIALGLDNRHLVLSNLRHFLERTLVDLIESVKKPHDSHSMPIARALILAAMLRELGSEHPSVREIVNSWKYVLESSLNADEFQTATFRDKCEEVFGPDYHFWPDQWPELGFSRYMLLLMKDELPFAAEKSMISYLINKSRGIYPYSNRSLQYFPLEFASREGVRYISSLEQLTQYTSSAVYLRHTTDWLWEQRDINGYWDLGTMARDNLYLPLSVSWRSKHVRQRDCTVRILILLTRLQQTCELYDTTCHFL